ncbi:MAG: PEP-CTERM sorting domain-containing protein [Burkholderiales bacterium]|jgi:hypothetical protein|nr:PEP-CTERM sorting domain-containing protein [Burkholderiales bacterium]
MPRLPAASLLSAVALAVTALAAPSSHAQVVDVGLNVPWAGDTPASTGSPWVNARFLDLGFTAGTDFDGVKNWVELQITTTQNDVPPALTPAEIAAAGFPLPQYQNLTEVVGLGNLTGGEYVNTIWFNFNPALDITKLEVFNPGFPNAGAGITAATIGTDIHPVGDSGLYDISISFAGANRLGPAFTEYTKLVFRYDGGNTNIDPSDFLFFSTPQDDDGVGPFVATASVFRTGPSGVGFIASNVPEPSTWALVALGLVGTGLALRRRTGA